MSRHDRIRAQLEWCVEKGIIRGWYGQTGMPGRRWVLEGVGFHTRVYTTSDVEAFLLGACEGRTTGLMDGRVRHAESALVRAGLGPRA